VGRLASLSLRSGIGIEDVIKQLKGIRCPSTIRQKGLSVLSCPDAIAKVLDHAEKAIRGEETEPAVKEPPKIPDGVSFTLDSTKMRFCPECGADIIHEGGCVICPQCGFSKCN
jgi:ribonucleoside-diphosphate reductase alpha chain